MITRLKITNLALIDNAELEFDAGLSVLTGETGEGKSIIVTAIALAIGWRAEREYVRAGERSATVEAVFDVSRMSAGYKRQFADSIIDGGLVIKREISATGSSKVRINDETATLARVRELTAPMAEILGQHSNQILLDESNHLLFLDHFAGVDNVREELAELFAGWEKLSSNIRRLKSKRDQIQKERDLLVFQRNELDSANIHVGEEQDLLNEKRILDSSQTLIELAKTIQELLDNEDRSALMFVRQIRQELDKMASIDEDLKPQASEIADIDFHLEEIRRSIEQYGNSVPDDPSKLEELNERLSELFELRRKYGDSEEAMLATLESIKTKLSDRPDVDTELAQLESNRERVRADYTKQSLALSAVRTKAAKYLERLTVKELAALAIDKARFQFELSYEEHPDGISLPNGRTVRPYAHGLEKGRILFSANPGEPLKSLVKTASGGEISRLLLAMKAAEKKNVNVSQSLLVFDEVDAGIGGMTANEVGRKLKTLSEGCQLLVVTHLHQIARQADHHFVARKAPQREARTVITISRLDESEVAAELDRMIALPD